MLCRLKFAMIQYPAPQNLAAGSAMIVADSALPINETSSVGKTILWESEWVEEWPSASAAWPRERR
jgi:hypothetical protein